MNDHALDALGQSFLGVLPRATRGGFVEPARVVELPAGKLVYDPEVSIIVEGTFRAFVADGSGRILRSPICALPIRFDTLWASSSVRGTCRPKESLLGAAAGLVDTGIESSGSPTRQIGWLSITRKM